MSTQFRVANSSFLKAQYYKIPFNIYQSGDLIEEDLYFLYQGNYLLYKLKNLIWKNEDKAKLDEFDVQNLYVKCATETDHHRFLETRLKRILDEQFISDVEKIEIIYNLSTSSLKDLFDSPHSSEKLKRSVVTIQHSIDYLSKDKKHFFDLMKIATSQFSEFTHGLHVASYSITLARQIGIKSFNQVAPIGIAAVLHDIGKVKIPKNILEKEETLNESERALIEKHSEFGYEIVHDARAIPTLAEDIILQHHERIDGSGYPKKNLDDITIYSQIVGLSDCFDLLTSDRPYRKALKPADAIQELQTTDRHRFDQELVLEFVKMLKR